MLPTDVILPGDLTSLKRMLRCDDEGISDNLMYEYRTRIRMFHSDGHSGPMGTLGLLDMLRHMKLGPKPSPESAIVTDWNKMPTNGTLRVEVCHKDKDDDGEEVITWMSGMYIGRVADGLLAVRLDGDTWVHEYRPFDVRLLIIKDEMPPKKPKKVVEPEPVRIPLASETWLHEVPEPEPEPEPEPDPMPAPPVFAPPVVELVELADPGDEVWVTTDGDIKDGTYQGRDSTSGKVFVQLLDEESPRLVDAKQITFTKVCEVSNA